METPENPEVRDRILIVEKDHFLWRGKTPYQVQPEIPVDIIETRSGFYIAIASQAPQAVGREVLEIELFVVSRKISPNCFYIPELT